MISVCMATHNGADWVREQLVSVLSELGPDDEVIIVDDASRDATLSVVEDLRDPRIVIWRNHENLGHVATFERALSLSSGDFVLLADQDDVWVPGRVKVMVKALKSHGVIASNFGFLDLGEERRRSGPPLAAGGHLFHFRNLLGIFMGRRAYFGCTMGMQRRALSDLLPFPVGTEAHDLWIALAANVQGQMYHLEQQTILRRIHGGNLTPRRRRGWHSVLRTRYVFATHVLVALQRKVRLPDRAYVSG